MLLTSCEIVTACPKGANLAEVKVIRHQNVQLSTGGLERRPVFSGSYTEGMPLGEGGQPVSAPIDLKPGDVVRVTAAAPQDPREVWDVTRGDKVIWQNEALKGAEVERQLVVEEKIALKKKLL